MKTLKRLFHGIKHRGLKAMLFRAFVLSVDVCYDWWYGIETNNEAELADLSINSENRENGTQYQASRVVPLRKLFKNIQSKIPKNSVLVDLGSGKGRVLLIAAEFGFHCVKGVEFARELVEIAKRNCQTYKIRTRTPAEFQIFHSDVVNYQIDDQDNVFFFFNPFDHKIMSQVKANIFKSLENSPRKIWIIYFNPKYENVFAVDDAFELENNFNFSKYEIQVYSTTFHAGDKLSISAVEVEAA